MKHKHTGLTLIELMVSLVLSAILLLGLIQTYQANKGSNNLQAAFARVQETGRISMDILARDIRMADYWGCKAGGGGITDHLDPGDAPYNANNFDWISSDPIEVIDNAPSPTVIEGVTVKPNTDVLTLRTSVDACNGKGKMHAMLGGNLRISQACNDFIEKGAVLLLTNCKAGDLFSVSSDLGGCAAGKCTLASSAGTINPDASFVNNLNTVSNLYGTDSRILRPVKKVYFISDTGGIPSLFVSENGSTPVQLVFGVEDMQLGIGQDTDNNGSVDDFTTTLPTGAGALNDVLSIRVSLVVSDDQWVDSAEVDGLLRKTFSSTSAIRNRALN